MAYFPQASPPTPCAPLYPPPYAPHALPISFVSILPPAQYWVRRKWHYFETSSATLGFSGYPGILRLPWLRFFRAFSSAVRKMPGYTSQRRGTVRTLPNYWIVLFYALFLSVVLFYVLFVCNCLPYYYHRMSTKLQLNISYQNLISKWN